MSLSPRPDFLAKRSDRRWAAWFIALGGLAALLVASYQMWSLQTAFDALAETPSHPMNLPTTAAGRTPAGETQGSADAMREARRVAVSLAYPWQEALASLEEATPQDVKWLSLEHASETGDARLEGQAADTQTAIRLIVVLAELPGWREVVLVRLQRGAEGADAGAGLPVRFAVEARFDTGGVAVNTSQGGS